MYFDNYLTPNLSTFTPKPDPPSLSMYSKPPITPFESGLQHQRQYFNNQRQSENSAVMQKGYERGFEEGSRQHVGFCVGSQVDRMGGVGQYQQKGGFCLNTEPSQGKFGREGERGFVKRRDSITGNGSSFIMRSNHPHLSPSHNNKSFIAQPGLKGSTLRTRPPIFKQQPQATSNLPPYSFQQKKKSDLPFPNTSNNTQSQLSVNSYKDYQGKFYPESRDNKERKDMIMENEAFLQQIYNNNGNKKNENKNNNGNSNSGINYYSGSNTTNNNNSKNYSGVSNNYNNPKQSDFKLSSKPYASGYRTVPDTSTTLNTDPTSSTPQQQQPAYNFQLKPITSNLPTTASNQPYQHSFTSSHQPLTNYEQRYQTPLLAKRQSSEREQGGNNNGSQGYLHTDREIYKSGSIDGLMQAVLAKDNIKKKLQGNHGLAGNNTSNYDANNYNYDDSNYNTNNNNYKNNNNNNNNGQTQAPSQKYTHPKPPQASTTTNNDPIDYHLLIQNLQKKFLQRNQQNSSTNLNQTKPQQPILEDQPQSREKLPSFNSSFNSSFTNNNNTNNNNTELAKRDEKIKRLQKIIENNKETITAMEQTIKQLKRRVISNAGNADTNPLPSPPSTQPPLLLLHHQITTLTNETTSLRQQLTLHQQQSIQAEKEKSSMSMDLSKLKEVCDSYEVRIEEMERLRVEEGERLRWEVEGKSRREKEAAEGVARLTEEKEEAEKLVARLADEKEILNQKYERVLQQLLLQQHHHQQQTSLLTLQLQQSKQQSNQHQTQHSQQLINNQLSITELTQQLQEKSQSMEKLLIEKTEVEKVVEGLRKRVEELEVIGGSINKDSTNKDNTNKEYSNRDSAEVKTRGSEGREEVGENSRRDGELLELYHQKYMEIVTLFSLNQNTTPSSLQTPSSQQTPLAQGSQPFSLTTMPLQTTEQPSPSLSPSLPPPSPFFLTHYHPLLIQETTRILKDMKKLLSVLKQLQSDSQQKGLRLYELDKTLKKQSIKINALVGEIHLKNVAILEINSMQVEKEILRLNEKYQILYEVGLGGLGVGEGEV